MKTLSALIVVDVQNDFCPGGSLAVKDGDQIVPIINKLLPEFDLVIFTKDWHDPEQFAFASQHPDKLPFEDYLTKQALVDTIWPDHCVQNTFGAELHKDLDFAKCKKDFYIFTKGSDKNHHPYSGFDGTGLAKFLKQRKVKNVYVTGLAYDYCVKETAVDAGINGFATYVIQDATKAINPNEQITHNTLKSYSIGTVTSENIFLRGE